MTIHVLGGPILQSVLTAKLVLLELFVYTVELQKDSEVQSNMYNTPTLILSFDAALCIHTYNYYSCSKPLVHMQLISNQVLELEYYTYLTALH